MANEPKMKMALVGEMPENPVRGTVYMSPDTSGNFVKVGVDGSVRTIFDGSDYVKKDESVWIPGYGENSAVLVSEHSYATGEEAVSHGYMTYAKGPNSHAEGEGGADFSISVYSDFNNNMIYGADIDSPDLSIYIDYLVNYGDACATITDAYLDKKGGVTFILDKPLLDDGSDFDESTEVYLFTGGIAAGASSHTEGDSTVAVGDFSHAEGCATYTGYLYSHAEGINTIAYGDATHVEGCETLATGYSSHAEGTVTTAAGDYSHAEGTDTIAYGDYSHAEGEGREFSITITGLAGATRYTVLNGLNGAKSGDIVRYASSVIKPNAALPYEKDITTDFVYAVITAVDDGKTVYIELDHTINPDNSINDNVSILRGVANGTGSHSEGRYTNAVGRYSHTEGYNTTASGFYSHAEGNNTTASGDYSHAEGDHTTASGDYSHAEGYNTTASGDYSHAQGSYNISHTDTLFSIGNGYHSNESDVYSNALEIMQNGDAYLYGVASFDGQTISSTKTLQYFLNVDPISNHEYDIIFGNNADDAIDFNTITRLHLYIDDYPSDMISEMMEDVGAGTLEEFYDIVYDVNINGNSQYDEIDCVHANDYVYEDTVEIDGTTYYLWHDSSMYAIMRTDVSMTYLDSIAKCNNPNSNVSPFTAIVAEDLAIRYDDTTDVTADEHYQLVCYKLYE